jgi:DmsE family decaheme c-type cytochrome
MKAVSGPVSALLVNEVRKRKWKTGLSSSSYLAAIGLLFLVLPGHPQPAHALDAISLAGVNSAFEATGPTAATTKASLQDDAALTAIRDFAQGLSPKQPANVAADGYADLRAYASGLGGDQAGARPSEGIKVAEAQTLMDVFRGSYNKDDAKKAAPAPKATKQAPANVVVKTAAEATFIGTKTCLGCHATQAASFGETLMGRIGKTHQGKFECENCHGPGSAHAKAGGGRGVGGIISFRKDDISRAPSENNAICLTCHERGDRTYWSGSTHEQRDVACTECHTVMQKVSPKFNLKTAFEPDTCFQCHKDRRAQMYRSSHMPLREGKIVCSDCHNPHGSATDALLRENSINDTCYKCHAEKRGPFLFEHLPVRENCDNCHEPHGSVNEFMLKVSRPRLCGECHGVGHGLTSGVNAVQTFSRSCQNCHNAVHGTNSPSGALLHR